MSGVGDSSDRLEPEIENALDPGRFVPDRGCFGFVDGLERVEAEIGRLVAIEPERAVALYETFLAGCYEKAEEVDDSSGSFGMFAQTLIYGWITARQAADACSHQTAARLLSWIDNDQYGFCHQLERQVATVLDDAGLAAFTGQIHARFEAAERAAAAPGTPDRTSQYARRRWADALRTLHAARNDLDAYIELATQTGLTTDDCLTVANMLAMRDEPAQALSWIERGLALDAQTPYGSFAGHSLAELKPRLLADLGRGEQALETAWADYRKHPSQYAYDHLMAFVPETERSTWHDKAIAVAMDGNYLPPLIELLLHTEETEHLAQLSARNCDSSLEALSHHVAEPAGTNLEQSHPGEAARIWRAQGMRILKASKNRYYDVALATSNAPNTATSRQNRRPSGSGSSMRCTQSTAARRASCPASTTSRANPNQPRSRPSWTGRRPDGPRPAMGSDTCSRCCWPKRLTCNRSMYCGSGTFQGS